MSDHGSKANFTRMARPMAPVLDLSGAVPDRLVSYSIQRGPIQPLLDLSPKVEAAPPLQAMSTPELLVFLKAHRQPSREQLLQIHDIAVERLLREGCGSTREAVELSRAAMVTALECAK